MNDLAVINDELPVVAGDDKLTSYYKAASKLKLKAPEQEQLIRPFEDEQVGIRPDGHLYIPQTFYRERLNKSIGVGQWVMIPNGQFYSEHAGKKKYFIRGILVIRGCFVSEAIGEAEMFDDNAQQSMGTVWESAKSDCLTRLCKDLSIGTQVYQPNYQKEWKKKYAIQVWCSDTTKPRWRHKDGDPLPKEKNEAGKPGDRDKYPFENEYANRPYLNETFRNGGVTGDWLKVSAGIKDHSMTLAIIEDNYRMSGEIKKKVLQLIKEAGSGQAEPAAPVSKPVMDPKQEKPEELPTINGKWYALLEKCKTKADVNALFAKEKAGIEADKDCDNIKKVFTATRNSKKS